MRSTQCFAFLGWRRHLPGWTAATALFSVSDVRKKISGAGAGGWVAWTAERGARRLERVAAAFNAKPGSGTREMVKVAF